MYQYNPYKLKYIKQNQQYHQKINFILVINGSIVGKFIWRILKQLNLINSINEPEGSKIYFSNILNLYYEDIISNNYDLIFMHVLVPHKPYGFKSDCSYDNKLSNLNYFFQRKSF